MKIIAKIKVRAEGIVETVNRFMMTILFLIAAVITNAVSINREFDDNYLDLMISFLLGACIYAVFCMVYERFCKKPWNRYLFMGITALITFIYYLILNHNGWRIEITLRTTVIFFALLIAFLWVPVIRSRYNFNDSFMAAFKAFFVALFFNGILFLGITLIFRVTDLLITSVNEKAYMHTANLIFVLVAPIHLLSLIPKYPRYCGIGAELTVNEDIDQLIRSGEQPKPEESEVPKESVVPRENEVPIESGLQTEPVNPEVLSSSIYKDHKNEDTLRKLITPVRFLSALISYVIIPVTAVFTVILLLYIIMNITGDFWTDNLLEPLLVAYSITVIIVYLLVSTVDNVFTKYFRLIFPKVLLPIVIFQTIASVLKIGEAGIGYGRYYVILFGVFATIAGVVFCIRPVRDNGIIAPVLIVLSIISILPGTGALTISRMNQIGRLEKVLEQNNMLKDGSLSANSNLSEKDKEIIISSVEYLNRMDYTRDISWLEDYAATGNFEDAFGFEQYPVDKNNNLYVMIIRDQKSPIEISGYDYMVRMNLYRYMETGQVEPFKKDGKTYQITLDGSYEEGYDIVLTETDAELIRFPMKKIYEKFSTNYEKTQVTTPEVTFTEENDQAVITVVAETISINQWENGLDREAEVYILVKIK